MFLRTHCYEFDMLLMFTMTCSVLKIVYNVCISFTDAISTFLVACLLKFEQFFAYYLICINSTDHTEGYPK